MSQVERPDLAQFRILTFDCYGTLIDWETGILTGLRRVLDAHGVGGGDEALLATYARFEAAAEAGPYLPYREVLARAVRGVCASLACQPTEAEVTAFAESVGDWPAFPDSPAALASLAEHFRLGVITNCDTDLFARSNERLGVRFEWVITAEQLGSYKPDPRNFELARAQIGGPPEQHLHVAQSLFHDHVPAQALGLSTAWINRRKGRPGSGATPAAVARPDFEFDDMAAFSASIVSAVIG
jgi:2-haloacid dehalogenase